MAFERKQLWIIISAGLVFALIFGVRQSQALFISPLNTATGLGIAAISLAFACAQLMWGITQPFAGAIADNYGSGRVIAIGAVLVTVGTVLTPYSIETFLIFAVVIGFTHLATVPPTVGLVAKLHGMRFMATLFGIVMLSHQVGGFLGAWLGGKLFEATGSYDWMWYIDILLAVGAALIHLPIHEAPKARVLATA